MVANNLSQSLSKNNEYLYRRLPKGHWSQSTNKVKPAAFSVKEGESLSVYAARLRTPMEVIQQGIDDNKSKLESIDEEGRKGVEGFLSRNGKTVEEFFEKGGRIARIEITEFTKRGCKVEPPDEKGHQDIRLASDDLELRKELAEVAVLLNEQECFQEDLREKLQISTIKTPKDNSLLSALKLRIYKLLKLKE